MTWEDTKQLREAIKALRSIAYHDFGPACATNAIKFQKIAKAALEKLGEEE